MSCTKCGNNGVSVTNDCNCSPIECTAPNPCSEIVSDVCVIHTGEDKVCGTDTVYAQGDTQEQINEQIVDYFCGSGSIQIPTLQVSTVGEKIFVHILPIEDKTFLTRNPRIFLFHKKQAKKRSFRDILDQPYLRRYHAGYHHPTHMGGVNFPNGKYYSGTAEDGSLYHTEFPVTFTDAYEKQELTDFNIREFYFLQEQLGLPQVKPFPLRDNSIVGVDVLNQYAIKCIGRRRNMNYSKSNYFRFAIAIDNPDTTSDKPVIFGDFSGVIQSMPFNDKYFTEGIGTRTAVSFKLLQETNAIKRTT